MSGLQLITSNPVVDEYDRRTQFANQQATQNLQNTAAQQAIDYNTQANPIRLRDITSTADINAAGAKVAGATTQDKIDQSGAQTRESGANADVAQGTVQPRISIAGSQAQEGAANAQVAAGTVQPRISQAGSAAQSAAANAAVDTGTVGSRISESGSNAAAAGSNAQTAAAGAQVAQATVDPKITLANAQAALAQNSVQYDKEGRFMDLWAKNPQAALTQAQAYGAPPELVAALQDQTKAAWINQAWASISAQYPGDLNAALRASIFEQKIKEAGSAPGGVPSPSAAVQIPAGSPPPMTQRDLLIQNAQLLGLKPGTTAYVAYVTSNGTKLPAGQVVTGDAAKGMGLDPGASWQQGADQMWHRLDTSTPQYRNYQTAQSDPLNPFKGSFTDFLQQSTGAMATLTARASAAGLTPGSDDYKAFMASNGQVGDPSTVESTAKMIADYKVAPLSGYALRTPWGQKVLAAVSAINPTYNATTYGERQKAAIAFGSGPLGSTVRSLNVAISHLNVIDKLGQALHNGNVQLFNSLVQRIGKETGAAAPTNFAAAKQVVAGEVVKAITAAGGALHDREEAQAAFAAVSSPEQLAGVTQTYRRLLAGQMIGLRDQYQNSTGLDDFNAKLSPDTAHELDALNAADTAAPAVGAGGGSIPEFADPNDPKLKAMPKGSVFYGVNGDGTKTLRFVP